MVYGFKNVSFDESEELWNDLAYKSNHSIFLTHVWQSTWWEIFGDSYELKLFQMGNNDGALGLAPMMLSNSELSFIGNTDLFDYHDFIGDPKYKPDAFYDTLINAIKNEDWSKLNLSSLLPDSATLDYLPERLRMIGCTVEVEIEDVVPGLKLTENWAGYIGGLRKKDRHELRRKFRRLDSAGEYQLICSDKETLQSDIDIFLEMMAESKEDKRDFMEPLRVDFFRRMIQTTYKSGYAQLYFLELESRKVAAALCFDIGGNRFLYNSGYRLEDSQHSVSLLLKALTINDAIEKGMDYYDFLRGNEKYKFHLGAKEVNLMKLVAGR